MNKLFATTAMALILSGAAFAQDSKTEAGSASSGETSTAEAGNASSGSNDAGAAMKWLTQSDEQDVFASEIIGATLYSDEDGKTTAEARDDWDSVGSIDDVVMNRDGEVRAVLVDVGEFLGMGGKTVAVPVDALNYVSDGEDADDYFLMIAASRDALESAPEYERSERESDRQADATQTSGEERGASEALESASESTLGPEGYSRASSDALNVDDLGNLEVYDRDDQNIGSVEELVVDDEGKVTHAVVDVGGFLGLGARQVALKFDELTIMRQDDGDDVRLYADATEEELEEMPRYEK